MAVDLTRIGKIHVGLLGATGGLAYATHWAEPGSVLLATTAAEELDPIAAIASFYPMVEALARARGKDPDHPRYLNKVTTTR